MRVCLRSPTSAQVVEQLAALGVASEAIDDIMSAVQISSPEDLQRRLGADSEVGEGRAHVCTSVCLCLSSARACSRTRAVDAHGTAAVARGG
jgi:hypothetical protein